MRRLLVLFAALTLSIAVYGVAVYGFGARAQQEDDPVATPTVELFNQPTSTVPLCQDVEIHAGTVCRIVD